MTVRHARNAVYSHTDTSTGVCDACERGAVKQKHTPKDKTDYDAEQYGAVLGFDFSTGTFQLPSNPDGYRAVLHIVDKYTGTKCVYKLRQKWSFIPRLDELFASIKANGGAHGGIIVADPEFDNEESAIQF